MIRFIECHVLDAKYPYGTYVVLEGKLEVPFNDERHAMHYARTRGLAVTDWNGIVRHDYRD